MAKEYPIAYCECSDEPVRLNPFYKLTNNGEFECYRGRCVKCGVRLDSKERIPEGHTIFDPKVCKRADRDYPQVIPSDLQRKLDEEKRLREQRNGKSEVDSKSTAVDGGGEL